MRCEFVKFSTYKHTEKSVVVRRVGYGVGKRREERREDSPRKEKLACSKKAVLSANEYTNESAKSAKCSTLVHKRSECPLLHGVAVGVKQKKR
jgi:hypothetical protein